MHDDDDDDDDDADAYDDNDDDDGNDNDDDDGDDDDDDLKVSLFRKHVRFNCSADSTHEAPRQRSQDSATADF